MNLKLFLLLPVFIALLYGCKKGTPGPANNGSTVTLPPVIVPTAGQVTIAGYVYKEDGSPADNTAITIGSSTIATGATGAFSYTGAVADSDKVVIRFTKPGYFDSWKTLVVENNAVYNGVKIYLRPEIVAGTFNAAAGGVVNYTNAYSHALAKLTFQANSIIREDGIAYSGIVTAIVLPTTYFDTMIELPGDKRAVDAGNHIVALENYGAICVKLKGAAGENLKLSKPMSYSCSLSPMAGNPASGTLKLWTFNEDTGLWVENSAANFNISYDNGSITPSVSGSTTGLVFLQWAVPYTAALLRAYISPAALGFALVNYNDRYNNAGYQKATFNSKGVCLMYIPAASASTAGLFSPCGDLVQNLNIPAVQAGTRTTKVLAADLSKFITVVTGHVDDCSFNSVNGRMELNLDGTIYNSPIVNGEYNFNVAYCTTIAVANANITIYDANNNVLRKSTHWDFWQGAIYRAGDISICSRPLTGTFTFNVEGKTYTFASPDYDVNFYTSLPPFVGASTVIGVNNKAGGNVFSLTTDKPVIGSFSILTTTLTVPASNYIMTWGIYPSGTVNITKYRTGTTLIEGNFKTNTTPNYCGCSADRAVELNGTFKIEQ